MRILVVEDDLQTATYILGGLRTGGHVVDHTADGADGLFLVTSRQYDVIVIDRMLPQLNGLDVVKAIRAAGIQTPVLFLTARASINDRVEGLEAGGDDYLTKPFAFSELSARIGALGRRSAAASPATVLQIGDLEMDIVAHRVVRGGRKIELQPREFRLLEYMIRNAGRVVTRTMLLENVWDFHFDPKTKIVETHISRLRAKIDRGAEQELIETVRGSGYVIRVPS